MASETPGSTVSLVGQGSFLTKPPLQMVGCTGKVSETSFIFLHLRIYPFLIFFFFVLFSTEIFKKKSKRRKIGMYKDTFFVAKVLSPIIVFLCFILICYMKKKMYIYCVNLSLKVIH